MNDAIYQFFLNFLNGQTIPRRGKNIQKNKKSSLSEKLSWLALLLLFFSTVQAQPYSYYISNNGDNSDNGTSTSTPFETLGRAITEAATHGSGDVVYLYFNRADTFDVNTITTTTSLFTFRSSYPHIIMDAFGTGAKPVFDGGCSDFSTAPSTIGTNYKHYFHIFKIYRSATFRNLRFQNIYANGIMMAGDGLTLQNCEFVNFGSCSVMTNANFGTENNLVENCLFHTGQQLLKYSKRNGWGGALNFTASKGANQGQTAYCGGSVIRYNVLYDIYGEGINAPNSMIEYNIVGACGSLALNCSPHEWDCDTAIIRYNLVVDPDWASTTYEAVPGGDPSAIRIYDEEAGGTNANADISIYGNIIINRARGMRCYCTFDCDASVGSVSRFGTVRVYNNTVIDSHIANFSWSESDETIGEGYFYNNLSLQYDQAGDDNKLIADNVDGSVNWTIDNNAFWESGGSFTVDTDWDNGAITDNPNLPGEIANFPWASVANANHVYAFDVISLLYPPTGSPLVGGGKTLGTGFIDTFLTQGTDFSTLPENADFMTVAQGIPWDIGALTVSDTTPPSSPSNLITTARSSSQIDLSWTDNSSDEDGFVVQRSTDTVNYSLVDTVAANITALQDTGLLASTTYYYRVYAFNTGGNSDYSNVDFATTFSDIDTTSTILVEDFNDGVADYWSVLTGSWSVSSNQYQQSSTSGTSVAYYTGGYTWGDYVYSADVRSANDVGITFRGSSDMQDYYIFKIQNTSTVELVKVANGNDSILNSYSYNTTAGQFYKMEVVVVGSNITLKIDGVVLAIFNDLSSSFSTGTVGLYSSDTSNIYDNVVVTEKINAVVLSTNVSSVSKVFKGGEDIVVFPNPANTILTVSGSPDFDGMAKVELYSITGAKMYQSLHDVSFPHQIDISTYTPGFYVVRVEKGTNCFTRNVVKK